MRFLAWRELLNKAEGNLPYIPPLDILMVWHSLLLNSSTFRDHFKNDSIYRIKFPWEEIHQHLDQYIWDSAQSPKGSETFEPETGMMSSLFAQFEDWKVDTSRGIREKQNIDNFSELMKRVPSIMVVPTLDIDLIWHTHQCTGAQYVTDTEARVGRFINHNDNLGTGTLDDGFKTTSRLYREHFGKDYNICGC